MIAGMLAVCLMLFVGCGHTMPEQTKPEQTATAQESQAATTEARGEHMLNGKRVLFVGNSHTYYGKVVLEKSRGVLTQEERSNDQGFFYQLCKANGAEVAVTNWTFGGHGFGDLFEVCAANRGCDGEDHKSYLTDRAFDYVFLQIGSGSAEKDNQAFLDQCEYVMAFFREANTEVKFLFLVQHTVHKGEYQWLPALKDLENMGVTVVDWGALVCDLINKKTEVPGGNQQYFQNTFIVSQSKSDGYHPNMLTGYLTALFAYCALTGESAVGQTYAFCNDSSVNTRFNFEKFQSQYYTHDPYTNFVDVFASEADMNGLQQLVDQYLTEKAYRNY
jgi:hypothetical protein